MVFVRVALAIVATFVLCGLSKAQEPFGLDDPLARLTGVLLQSGSPGTLTAVAAERFGLPHREYRERYVEVIQPDGTHRSIEVIADEPIPHIFFSQQTGAELITIRSNSGGEFIMGLQRPNDSNKVQDLSGNQGRVFLEAQKAYWLKWLAREK